MSADSNARATVEQNITATAWRLLPANTDYRGVTRAGRVQTGQHDRTRAFQ